MKTEGTFAQGKEENYGSHLAMAKQDGSEQG